MVYKRDVCKWFHELDAPSRIEVVCELLKMCLPLELRLFGSCLEELARKDFLRLKEQELRANAFKGLESLEELSEPGMRSLLITYVCLLHPSNKQCSTILFNVLSGLVPKLELLQSMSSVNEYIEDILLLMTIAIHHPAFCFDQKQQLIEHLKTIKTLCISKQNGLEAALSGSSPATMSESAGKQDASFVQHFGCSIKSDCALKPDGSAKKDMRMVGNYSHPTAISLLGINSQAPAQFTVEVTWSTPNTPQKSVVTKTMDDLSKFHSQLMDWSSTANVSGASFAKSMTRMKSSLQGALNVIRCGTLNDKFVKKLSSYFEELFKANDTVPKCDATRQFFSASSIPKGTPALEEGESASVHGRSGASNTRSSGGTSPSMERIRTASKKVAQISYVSATNEVQGPQTADYRLAFGSSTSFEPASELGLLAGSGDTKEQQWCDQLANWLENIGLRKHVKKLPNVSRERLICMTESEVMRKFGLSELQAKQLLSEREKLMLSNGLVRPVVSTSRTSNPSDDRSQHFDMHVSGVPRLHLKDEGRASVHANVGAHAIPSDEPHSYELEQNMSRRTGLQSGRNISSVPVDQTCTVADDATTRKMQEIHSVARPSIAPGLSGKERKLPRSQTSNLSDGISSARRSGSRNSSDTAGDSSHGPSHQHRQGTVLQAAAAAAASCASGIQPLAGGKLRDSQASLSKKTSVDGPSGVSSPPSLNSSDVQHHAPVDGRLLSSADESTFANSSASMSVRPPSNCPSPEGSSSSDGGEPHSGYGYIGSQRYMPVFPPTYHSAANSCNPEYYSVLNMQLPLTVAPSTSQVSPSNQGPVTFVRSMGAPSFSHRPHMPPSHGGRYATMPAFAHGVHGLAGGMVLSQNEVPGVLCTGGTVAGDPFFQSRQGPFLNLSSQTMSASYPRPLLSPHAYGSYQRGQVLLTSNHFHGSKNGCYNCGQTGHRASECREPFPDNLSSHYRLNYESQPDTD